MYGEVKMAAKKAVLTVFIALVVCCIIGLFVWLLWNQFMPAKFGVPTLTYFQVTGIIIVVNMLVINIVMTAKTICQIANDNN